MPDVSLAALGLRLAVSMGVVIALMLLAAKLLRRAQAYAAGGAGEGPRRRAGSGDRPRRRVVRTPITVSSITPLGRGASVALVRAAGRELVVGVTEHQVTLLHSAMEQAEDAEPALPAEAVVPDDLTELLQRAPEFLSHTPDAARIAASVLPHPQDAGTGTSAWMAALETMRARTVRH